MNKLTKTITREQALDNKKCPICGSTNIRYITTHYSNGWSCPACSDCHFSAGGAAANSSNGIWISFKEDFKKTTFEVTYLEATALNITLSNIVQESLIDLSEIEYEQGIEFRDKLLDFAQRIVANCILINQTEKILNAEVCSKHFGFIESDFQEILNYVKEE